MTTCHMEDFPGVNHSISFSFAILCVYISLFNLQIPSLVYINVHEYFWTPSSFLYTCSQFARFTFINIYVKIQLYKGPYASRQRQMRMIWNGLHLENPKRSVTLSHFQALSLSCYIFMNLFFL
jgi:hypothetical protein